MSKDIVEIIKEFLESAEGKSLIVDAVNEAAAKQAKIGA